MGNVGLYTYQVEAHLNSRNQRLVVTNSPAPNRSARLCFGPWGIGCVQHQYPDIHKRQYGDGQRQAWGSEG